MKTIIERLDDALFEFVNRRKMRPKFIVVGDEEGAEYEALFAREGVAYTGTFNNIPLIKKSELEEIAVL